MENPITRFVARYFSLEPAQQFQEATVCGLGLLKRISAVELLSVVSEVAAAVMWVGGPEGPMEEEIEERVEKIGAILSRHDLGDVEPGRFFAALLILGKHFATLK